MGIASKDMAGQAERAFTNAFVGPSAGGVVCLLLRKHLTGFKSLKGIKWDTMAILNGVLCGLVGVTGNAAMTETWAAVVIGGVAPIFYSLTLRASEYLKIDDPCESFAIHAPCGAWGIFATAFFNTNNGVFYHGAPKIIGIQLLGIVSIMGWNILTCMAVLLPLKVLSRHTRFNCFRVSIDEEEIGIDYF